MKVLESTFMPNRHTVIETRYRQNYKLSFMGALKQYLKNLIISYYNFKTDIKDSVKKNIVRILHKNKFKFIFHSI